MASTIAQSVGVDIAKDTFDVYLHPAGRVARFANDARGRSALVAWLEGFAIARIAFEPTGAYHHALERRLAAAGLPLVKVDPRRAAASPRRSAGMPKPTRSTPPCLPASRRCSSRRCGP
jgi:transposase